MRFGSVVVSIRRVAIDSETFQLESINFDEGAASLAPPPMPRAVVQRLETTPVRDQVSIDAVSIKKVSGKTQVKTQ